MPTVTRVKISSSITRRGRLIAASLFVLVAAIILFLGCRMKSSDASPSPAGPQAAPEVYDSAFLKFLAAPSALPPLTPGLRKVGALAVTSESYALSGRAASRESYEISLDTSQQVLELMVPEDTGYGSRGESRESLEAPLYPSFSEASRGESFTSAAALALKAKQFDDGLYAAVEMAADTGMDRFPGRKSFLLTLLNAVSADSDHNAAVLLTAAARLGEWIPRWGRRWPARPRRFKNLSRKRAALQTSRVLHLECSAHPGLSARPHAANPA